MNYKRTITREHRTAYVLLLDCSGSMRDVIDYDERIMTKGESMIDAANKILQELYLRAYRDGELRNYYDVAVICYSGYGIHSMLSSDRYFVPISEIKSDDGWVAMKCLTPFDMPGDDHGTKIVIDPEGYTPMHEALHMTHELLEEWCDRSENYDSAPPTVFHITDGHATDGGFSDIIDISERIMSVKTNDGAVLMFNIHLSPKRDSPALLFPTDREIAEHPSAFFRAMGFASSPMPQNFVPLIHEVRGFRSVESYRGVGFNVSVVDMISMMNIGTLSVPVG